MSKHKAHNLHIYGRNYRSMSNIFVKSQFTQKQFNCKIFQSNWQSSLVAEDYSLFEENFRQWCHPKQALELFEQAEADVKCLSLNSNTQGHFSKRELSAFPLRGGGGSERKNSALAPGNHFGNERQKRLKCCNGGKEKKFTLRHWGLLMSLTPPRINSLINMYT